MKKRLDSRWIGVLSLIWMATVVADAEAIPARQRLNTRRQNPRSRLLVHNFSALQGQFARRGRVYVPGKPKTVVVMPSLSLDPGELAKIHGAALYEERMLYNLLHLRDKATKVRFVSSHRIDPTIVRYYLDLLPAAARRTAKRRLEMIAVDPHGRMGQTVPLARKLMMNGGAMARVRAGIDPDEAHIYPFIVTRAEARAALRLNVPVLGARPEHADRFGTKAGCRRLFAEAGVPHPPGIKEVRSVEGLIEGLARFVDEHPDTRRMVVKLNEGFSGEGNAMLRLEGLSKLEGKAREQEIARRLPRMKFMAAHEHWGHFSQQIVKLGAIAEAFIEGKIKRSPSVQVYIGPDGKVELLSTYEQILGGPGGQEYLGGPAPALAAYRDHLHQVGLSVGKRLAKAGVMGRFAIDFMAVKQETRSDPLGKVGAGLDAKGSSVVNGWDVQAIEINLRAGGTTHPTNTAKLLLDGHYDPQSGAMVSGISGSKRYYMGHDNVDKEISPNILRGLSPTDVVDLLKRAGLHYDPRQEKGIVLHLMGAIRDFGKVGFTAIGASPRDVHRLHRRLVRVLGTQARKLKKERLVEKAEKRAAAR